MTYGTKYAGISDEREGYKLTQEGVPVGEDCENQPDRDYCDSVPRVDYDYADCTDVDYVFVIVLARIRKRRTRATDYSRFGHRGPRIHAARSCRLFGVFGLVHRPKWGRNPGQTGRTTTAASAAE